MKKSQPIPRIQGIKTEIEWMKQFEWNKEDVEKCRKTLEEWDSRDKSFYKDKPKFIMKVDLVEREHFRNTLKYYEDRLKDES